MTDMPPHLILFIGNSHTYLHHMPWMLEQLAEAAGHQRKLRTKQVTGKGASLKWHWRQQVTHDIIAAEKWRHVILQERSGGPLEDPDAMQRYARLFDAKIKKQGAGTLFYMTWARYDRPNSQKIISQAYSMAAGAAGALLAPVGTAWENALKTDPGLRLHHDDGRHANPAGAYLSACVFFTLICQADPRGLPGTLYRNHRCLVELEKDPAGFLQKTAFETVHKGC
jgi:hypothetical protein